MGLEFCIVVDTEVVKVYNNGVDYTVRKEI